MRTNHLVPLTGSDRFTIISYSRDKLRKAVQVHRFDKYCTDLDFRSKNEPGDSTRNFHEIFWGKAKIEVTTARGEHNMPRGEESITIIDPPISRLSASSLLSPVEKTHSSSFAAPGFKFLGRPNLPTSHRKIQDRVSLLLIESVDQALIGFFVDWSS